MNISTALQAKAQRLVVDGKVHRTGNVLTYSVEGDSGTWRVLLSYPQEAFGVCECPSKADVCSHLFAASIDFLADPPLIGKSLVPSTDPFEGLN